MRPYTPISCSFVDLIEHYATKQMSISIMYNDGETQTSIIEQIKTWEIKDSVEYMVLTNGTIIRMDDIISIDGNKLSEYERSCGI